MIGQALTTYFIQRDCPVVHLVRRPVKDELCEIFWDPLKGELDVKELEGFDVVINLAGLSIIGLWTPKRKRLLLESRVHGTSLLADKLSKIESKPAVFINASGINIYGRNTLEEEGFSEESTEDGKDYLARVIRRWEAAAQNLVDVGVRVCHLRMGAVLSPSGGMLGKMLKAFRLAAGGRIGKGAQALSWVSLEDVTEIIWHLIEREELEGPINVVAPEPVSNKEFTATLAKAVSMPAFFHIPAFLVRILLGEMGETLMLSSIKCQPKKLLDSGFEFKLGTLKECLASQLNVSFEEKVEEETVDEEKVDEESEEK